MDLGLLHRYGSRHADEGTGRVRRAPRRRGTLSHLDAPMARTIGRQGVPLAGTLLFILLAAPWYAAMFLVHGDAYATGAKAHTIGRFLSPMEGHQGTIFFYLPVILLGFFPWSALLPVPLYQTFKNWHTATSVRHERKTRSDSSPSPLAPHPSSSLELDLFAALWIVGTFVFFTASATRLPHYIGPLFPAAALLTASYWSRCLQDPTTKGIRGSIHLMMGLWGISWRSALPASPRSTHPTPPRWYGSSPWPDRWISVVAPT